MKQGKIVITIIHFNTPKYLKTCLDSIFAQTCKNIEVVFIDNASPSREGIEFVKKNYQENISDNTLKIVINNENTGYSKAANQGIGLAIEKNAEYAVITNPDIIYEPDYFEKILPIIQKDTSIASITGKILKYDFENRKKTNIIDSTGLLAFKNRRIIDRGQGEEDKGQYNKEEDVFGVSGACPLYRIKALNDVKIEHEYFDEDFFMYKEDVDLSWRFLLYGWKNRYFPGAKAYHGRGTGIHDRNTTIKAVKNRKHLTKFQKKYSFRNQKLMETKNQQIGVFFRNFFPIMLRKIATPFYITIKEPYLWGGYISYLKKLPKALKKRREIMKKAKLSSKESIKYFH